MLREKTRKSGRLERSGRITPREVLGAYARTGLRPQRKVYREDNGACAVGVLMTAHGDWKPNWDTTEVDGVPRPLFEFSDALEEWANNRMEIVGTMYETGFTIGFDGKACPKPGDDDHPLMRGSEGWERLGWRDGKRAARFVFREAS